VATNVELDELATDHYDHATSAFKKYKIREDSLIESHKKYVKLQKTFSDSMISYKSSLSDVKLIYNKDETLKRYQVCEMNFKNILTEEKVIE
jgi:hypothetical protein